MAKNDKKKKEEQNVNGVAKTTPTSVTPEKNKARLMEEANKRNMAGFKQRKPNGDEYTSREVQTRITVDNLFKHKDNSANANRTTSTTRTKTELPEVTGYKNKVTVPQKQIEKAETKRAIADSVKEDRSDVTYSNGSKHYTKQEKNNEVKDYYSSKGKNMYELQKEYDTMSDEEKAEFDRIKKLQNNNSLTSALGGFIEATPGLSELFSKLQKQGQSYEDVFGEANENYKGANMLGQFASKGLQYAGMNDVLGSIPVLQKANEGIANSLGGGKIGQYVADTTLDLIPDLFLDTLPTEIKNAKSGMSGSEIAKDTLKNIGTNELFNLGAGAIPYLGDALSNRVWSKNLQEGIGDTVKQSIDDTDKFIDNFASNRAIANRIADETKANATESLDDYAELFKQAREKELAEQAIAKRIAEEQNKNQPESLTELLKQANEIPNTVDDDNVIYHSGVLSKLNKAEGRGQMGESSRNTGYYGTGHYFVDGANKKWLDTDKAYNSKPYSSVDISKTGNLYRATTDENANALHKFATDYTRLVNGRDIDTNDLFKSYKKLFPESPMTKKEFINEINGFKETEKFNYLENREDSVFTQFMKKRGYNGVDTRGTNAADVEKGIVIYDLPEEAVIQSNISDAASKSGKMNTVQKDRNVFDANTDAELQKLLDSQKTRRTIDERVSKEFDNKKLDKLQRKLDKAKQEVTKNEDAISYYQNMLDPNSREYKQFARELKAMGLDINNYKDIDGNSYDVDLANALAKRVDLANEVERLQKQFDAEESAKNSFRQSLYDELNQNTPAELPTLKTTEELNAHVSAQPKATTEQIEKLVNGYKEMGFDDEEIVDALSEFVGEDAAKQWLDANKKNVAETIADTSKQTVAEISGDVPSQNVSNPKVIGQNIDQKPVVTNAVENVKPKEIPSLNDAKTTDKALSKHYGNLERNSTESMVENQIAPNKSEFEYDVKHNADTKSVGETRLTTDGDEYWSNELIRKVRSGEELTAEDGMTYTTLYKKLMDNGQEEEALSLAKNFRPSLTNAGQFIQTMKDLSNDPNMIIEEVLADVRRSVDKKHLTKGYSDAVENAANQVGDALKSGDVNGAKELLEKDLGAYAYGKNKVSQKKLSKKSIKGKEEALKLMANLGENVNNEQWLKVANDVVDAIKKNNGVATVTDADMVKTYQLLKKAQGITDVNSREYAEATAQAAKIIGEKIPTTFGDKFKTFLYDNMLGNLRTTLTRNAGGNVVGNGIEKAQKPLKTLIDSAVGKITGNRNYILDKDLIGDYTSGFKKGLSDQTLDIKNGVHTARSGEEYDFSKLVGENTKMYKGDNLASKALNTYDNIVKNAMTYGDRPFYEAEYKTAKHELQKIVEKYGEDALSLNGLPENTSVDTDAIIDILARNRALEAVYQKGTLTSDGFTKFKNGLGQISEGIIGTDLLSQSSMPFLQVPANMFERLVDYLPGLGTAKNVITTGKEIANDTFNQKRFVDALSRNIVGTGLLGGAATMAKNGMITGGYSDDADKANAQRAAGELEYAIVLPDGTQMDISDMPVVGPMAQAGSAFNEAYQQNEDNKVNALFQGAKAGTSSALETSALQGLNRLFGTNLYSNNGGIGSNVADTVLSASSQLIPSLIRQTTQVIDKNKRDLGEYGTAQYYLNNAINSTPLRMSMLNPKIDNEGREVLQNQGRSLGSKMLENYVLPYTISKPDYSDIGNVANNIYENSSDNSAEGYPSMTTRSKVKEWLGDDYSEEKFYNIKKEIGDLNTELGNAVINSDFFDNLDADSQGKVLSEVYSTSKTLSRLQNDPTFETDDKLVQSYLENGADGVASYIAKKTAFNSADVSISNKSANEAYEKGGASWKQFVKMNDALKEYGYTTSNEKAVEAYNNGTLEKYSKMDNTFKSYDLSASDENIDFYNTVGESKFNEYASYISKNGIKNNTQSRTLYQKNGTAGLDILKGADTDKSGTLKKDDELIPYLKRHNYSIKDANKIITSLGWKEITKY